MFARSEPVPVGSRSAPTSLPFFEASRLSWEIRLRVRSSANGRVRHVGALIASVLSLGSPWQARAEEEVRIAILSGASTIPVSGEKVTVFDAESGDRIAGFDRRGAFSIDSKSGFLEVASSRGPLARARSVLVEAEGGVRAGQGVYLGRIEIRPEARSDRLVAINRLPLETYLLGIVGSEMNPAWPIEALKAQAVAARTYAMQRRMMMRAADRPYDLESSVLSQVYKGAERIRPSVIRAVKETMGEVMSWKHDLAEALFHSTCGGRTRSAKSAFGHDVPYLRSEACDWCRDSNRRSWQLTLPLKDLARQLDRAGLVRDKLDGLERRKGAAKVSLRIRKNEKSLSPSALREAIGYTVLYSDRFIAETRGKTVSFEGTGFGHGVGMCQWGARGMAAAGKTYREILEHYYRGVRIARIY